MRLNAVTSPLKEMVTIANAPHDLFRNMEFNDYVIQEYYIVSTGDNKFIAKEILSYMDSLAYDYKFKEVASILQFSGIDILLDDVCCYIRTLLPKKNYEFRFRYLNNVSKYHCVREYTEFLQYFSKDEYGLSAILSLYVSPFSVSGLTRILLDIHVNKKFKTLNMLAI